MSGWILLWKICLIVAMILFSGLAIVVTIGGARDLRRLFEHLQAHSETETENDN